MFTIFLPFSLFFLTRITLPVPHRAIIQIDTQTQNKNTFDRRIPASKNPFTHIVIGNYPYHYNVINGVTIPLHSQTSGFQSSSKEIEIAGNPGDTLEFDYSVLNSNHNHKHTLKILDETHHVLFSDEFTVETSTQWNNNNIFSKVYFYRIGLNQNDIFYHHGTLSLKKTTHKLIILTSTSEEEDSTFAFGNLYFSKKQTHKPQLKKTLVILLNGMNIRRFQTTNHYQFLKRSGFFQQLWTNYYVSSSNPKRSLQNIFDTKTSQSLDKNHIKLAYVGSPVKKGEFEDELDSFFAKCTFKKINNIPQYETPENINDALNWMKENQDSSYLLILNLGTLQSPYYPPFENLNAIQLLKHPFGLPAKETLFSGLEKFQDNQFSLLIKNFETLPDSKDINVIATSMFGVQLSPFPWNQFSPSLQQRPGAIAWPNDSFFDEDIHVPVFLRDHTKKQKEMKWVNHLLWEKDLAQVIEKWNSIGKTEKQNLKKRKWIFLTNAHSFGYLKENKNTIEKYFFDNRRNEQTLYFNTPPWKKRVKIPPFQTFTQYHQKSQKESLSSISRAFAMIPLKNKTFQNPNATLHIALKRFSPNESATVSFLFASQVEESSQEREIKVHKNELTISLPKNSTKNKIEFSLKNNNIVNIISHNKIFMCLSQFHVTAENMKNFLRQETCYFHSIGNFKNTKTQKEGIQIQFSLDTD